MLKRAIYPAATSPFLFALCPGLLGALFDHYYAERQPWHDHVWSGAVGEHQPAVSDVAHLHDVPLGDASGPITAIVSNHASRAYLALLSLGAAVALYFPRSFASGAGAPGANLPGTR